MAYWLLSVLYVGLACAVLAVELRRGGKISADPLGIFVFIVTLQCVLPGIVTYALLPVTEPGNATGMDVFDRIYHFAEPAAAYTVFSLTGAFIFFVYVGAITTRRMLVTRFGEPADQTRIDIRVSTLRLVPIVIIGLAVTLAAFQSMGDSLVERYANLILLRSVSTSVEQTALASNALALAQAWAWLTIVAMFAIAHQRRRRTALWYLCLLMLIVFAIFGVSRRALFLPILFAYLTLVMSDGRWRAGKLLALSLAVLPVIAFGKELLGVISYGGAPDQFEQTYSTLVSAGIRMSTDIGVTVTESLGTLSMMDLPPRLGADHALSMIQRFPEGMLGLQIDFPPRVVRLSTEAFADEWTVDIPPGLFGQMWLDFRVFGPLIWGLAFGLQIGILQYAWGRVTPTKSSAAVFFLLIFVVALPINSGSFDFTFSVDIIAAIMVLVYAVRVRHQVPGDHDLRA